MTKSGCLQIAQQRGELGRRENGRWKMWNCGSVKIWKYENMKMPSGAIVASGYDAGGKNAREFNFHRQRKANFYATRGELDDSVFKVGFHVQSFPYFHNFILAYFHTSTISPSASLGAFASANLRPHLFVPISNGIRPSRRQAFANTTNAVVIDIPISLQNSLKSLLRSSSIRMLNAVCAILTSPVFENAHIVSYFTALSNLRRQKLQNRGWGYLNRLRRENLRSNCVV